MEEYSIKANMGFVSIHLLTSYLTQKVLGLVSHLKI